MPSVCYVWTCVEGDDVNMMRFAKTVEDITWLSLFRSSVLSDSTSNISQLR